MEKEVNGYIVEKKSDFWFSFFTSIFLFSFLSCLLVLAYWTDFWFGFFVNVVFIVGVSFLFSKVGEIVEEVRVPVKLFLSKKK